MNTALLVAIWAEAVKLRRSRVLWLTAAGLAIGPLMGGLFMLALRDSQGTPGLLGGKANALAGTADWPGYLGLLMPIIAVGGLLVFGVLTAWIFGREFSDRTALDLLALPTPRAAVVTAKFVVIAAWSAALTGFVLVTSLAVGGALGLPGWSADLVLVAAGDLATLFALSVVLVTPIALAASMGRGYLPAVGLMLLVTVVAQALAAVGLGAWFPWSVPALASGIAGPVAADALGVASYLLVGLTAIAGAILTVAWWRLADH